MKCVGIIWNCAYELRNEILELIGTFASVSSFSSLELGARYEEFVRSIYALDTIAEWKVDAKVEHMQSTDCTSVYVVYFDVDTSRTYYHDKKKHLVYTQLQDMKDCVRANFKERVKDYFFDIIFHCSESEEEFINNERMIESYRN